MFGWKRADGTRRFRTAYLEVAKKNGKSTMLAGIGLFLLVADGEEGAEVYSIATKRDQARIIFGEAQRMVRHSPQLLETVSVFKHNLSVDSTGSKFEPLSSDEKSGDGLNPSAVLADELHRHKSRALLDVFDNAMGARREPQLWVITTAGDESPESVYAQEHEYARKVVEAALEDDTLFAFIATLDEGDDPFDPKNWPKANPNLGISVKMDDMRRQAHKAQKSPAAKSSFQRLRLNVRTSSDAKPAISAEAWRLCGGALDLSALRGRPCFGGLDLSAKNDLTALVLVFPIEDRLDVLPFFWKPADGLEDKEQQDRVPYRQWRDQGFLNVTPGKTIGYDFVAQTLGALRYQYQIRGIAYDRAGIDQFLDALSAAGVEAWIDKGEKRNVEPPGLRMAPWGQGFIGMAPAFTALEDSLLEQKLRHGMHPVLTWNAASAKVRTDPAGGRKFDKIKSTGRIDGIVALAMACGLAKQGRPAGSKSYLEKQDLLVL